MCETIFDKEQTQSIEKKRGKCGVGVCFTFWRNRVKQTSKYEWVLAIQDPALVEPMIMPFATLKDLLAEVNNILNDGE